MEPIPQILRLGAGGQDTDKISLLASLNKKVLLSGYTFVFLIIHKNIELGLAYTLNVTSRTNIVT